MGNAIMVASSIFEAAIFRTFQKTPFKGKCAVVTSYNPQTQDVTKEETGANTETERVHLQHLHAVVEGRCCRAGKTKTETYEERAKANFTRNPPI